MNRAAAVGLAAIVFMFLEPWIRPYLDRRPADPPPRPTHRPTTSPRPRYGSGGRCGGQVGNSIGATDDPADTDGAGGFGRPHRRRPARPGRPARRGHRRPHPAAADPRPAGRGVHRRRRCRRRGPVRHPPAHHHPEWRRGSLGDCSFRWSRWRSSPGSPDPGCTTCTAGGSLGAGSSRTQRTLITEHLLDLADDIEAADHPEDRVAARQSTGRSPVQAGIGGARPAGPSARGPGAGAGGAAAGAGRDGVGQDHMGGGMIADRLPLARSTRLAICDPTRTPRYLSRGRTPLEPDARSYFYAEITRTAHCQGLAVKGKRVATIRGKPGESLPDLLRTLGEGCSRRR